MPAFSRTTAADTTLSDRRRDSVSRFQLTFSALIAAQAAHSVEEYVGRLWASFPPAAFVSGLVARDLETGFIAFNCALVGFGIWCAAWPVRLGWPSARKIALFWIAIETINGIGHPAWSLLQRGYTPGLLTAPILLALAVMLAGMLPSTVRGADDTLHS